MGEVVSDNSRKIWSGNMWCTEIVTNLGDEVQAPKIHQTHVGTENCNQYTYMCHEMIGNGPRKCNRVATLNLLYHCKASWNISQPFSNASFSINFRFSMKSFWCECMKKQCNPLANLRNTQSRENVTSVQKMTFHSEWHGLCRLCCLCVTTYLLSVTQMKKKLHVILTKADTWWWCNS